VERTGTDKTASLPATKRAPRPTPVIDSTRLFDGHREIQIRHGDETYRLRITSNGKLILNK
jgi:hemin uptake protein HemP